MENKKYTIEELEEKYKACIHQSEMIRKQIDEKKKEEEKELAKIKDARKAEIDEVFEHLKDLIDDYTKDYGSYEYEDDNFPYLYHLFFNWR